MNIPSLRELVSAEEWQLRVDLAACYRLVALYGWSDLVFTHISARIPGPEHHFLINPYGLMFDEITASTLVKIDMQGNVLDDPSGLGMNLAGFVIHGCVHQAREDVNCVIHTHTRAGVAVSAQKQGLLPLSQHAVRVYATLSYHDYEGLAVYEGEQQRLVANLGDKTVMILRNHGLLATGRSIPEAFRRIYYLEIACRLQLDVMATGRPWSPPPPEVCAHTAKQWDEGAAAIGTGNDEATREWPAMLRMLDRKYPGWRE